MYLPVRGIAFILSSNHTGHFSQDTDQVYPRGINKKCSSQHLINVQGLNQIKFLVGKNAHPIRLCGEN